MTTAVGKLESLIFDPDSGRFLLRLFLFAFAIRLAFNLLFRDIFGGPTNTGSADDLQFHLLGVALAEGRGYVLPKLGETAFRSPGFPLFLGAIYSIFGVTPLIARLSFCALGALSCILAVLVARRLLDDERMARTAGMLMAVYLGSIYYAMDFLSEAVFIPLLAVFVLQMLRYLESGSLLTLAICGALLGYLALLRPFILLAAPMYALLVMWRLRRQPGTAVIAAAVLTAATCVTLAPWVIRNQIVLGHPVLTTNGGSTFYGSNNGLVSSLSNPKLLGTWVSTTDLPGRDLIDAQPNEVEHDRMEWKLGQDWVRENAARLPLMIVAKIVRGTMGPPDFDPVPFSHVLRIGMFLPFLAMFVAGIVCVVTRRDYWSERWLVLHAVNIALLVSMSIFAGLVRFRDGNSALLMIYAVIGAWVLARLVREYGPRLIKVRQISPGA